MNIDPIYGPYYLPEVVIKDKKTSPLLVPYRGFDKKFNEETGWNNLSGIERLLSLLSVPQAFITYHSTKGKHITPSKALGIDSPLGSFLTDAILDVPLPKVSTANKTLGISSSYIKMLKKNLLEDLIRKIPNMDKSRYNTDLLLSLFKEMEKSPLPSVTRHPLIPSSKVVSIVSKNDKFPFNGAEILVSKKDATGRSRLFPTLAHELGHMYDFLSSRAAIEGKTSFSEDLLESLYLPYYSGITDNLKAKLFLDKKIPYDKSLSILQKYSKKISQDRDYFDYGRGEAYPMLLQTISTLPDVSTKSLAHLSRKKFKDLLSTAYLSSHFSNDPVTFNRLIMLFDTKDIGDRLYDYIQQHPVINTKKP